ncbi:MAG: rod-binding protein [Rhodospirillales bacterium]|nr:rod-binding protein [Rhodospirillales bacterium]
MDPLQIAPGTAPGTAEGTEAPRRLQARRAAEDFEAMFLSQMLAPVFADIGKDAMFGGGPGEQVYRSMMVQEYGKAIARAGGLGIADSVEREILKLQEMAQ